MVTSTGSSMVTCVGSSMVTCVGSSSMVTSLGSSIMMGAARERVVGVNVQKATIAIVLISTWDESFQWPPLNVEFGHFVVVVEL